jgi:hypothetical protein
MPLAAWLLILSAIVLTGCRTAQHAAVSTFRVIDAPAHYVREHIDQSEAAATTTTTDATVQGTSDVATPGRPVAPSTQQTTTSTTTERSTADSRPSPRPSSSARTDTTSQTKTTAASRSANTPPADFPVAQPVPGKPGFVYSIDPKGGMVDVTGYKSGDKAKDPYTHQIFVVP